MRYSGVDLATVAEELVEREGPTFNYGDPAAERLLYARARWGIENATDVPPADPKPLKVGSFAHGSERDRLAVLWTSAWNGAWREHTSALALLDTRAPLLTAASQTLDWATAALPFTVPAEGLADWRASLPAVSPLGVRYEQVATEAAAAYDRGLRAVYVVPVEGEWWSRQPRLLLISQAVHDSTDGLAQALNRY